MLLEREGYEVLTASDGAAGLKLFAARLVDLVVLDYQMPGFNGAAVAKKMREIKPEVPVVMLSAHFEPPPETNGLVDAYVTKGENPRVLLEQITRLTRQRGPARHPD